MLVFGVCAVARRRAAIQEGLGGAAAGCARRGAVSAHAFFDELTLGARILRSGGAARAGALPARPRGCAATAPRCQRARAPPAGRKQAISALLFKVLMRGRASSAAAAAADNDSGELLRTILKLSMLAVRRAAQNERRLV